MSVIFVLISASLIIALGFLVAFIWSVKSGQYDDDYTPSVRMLFDDNKSITKLETAEEKKIKKNHQINISHKVKTNLWKSKNFNTTTKS